MRKVVISAAAPLLAILAVLAMSERSLAQRFGVRVGNVEIGVGRPGYYYSYPGGYYYGPSSQFYGPYRSYYYRPGYYYPPGYRFYPRSGYYPSYYYSNPGYYSNYYSNPANWEPSSSEGSYQSKANPGGKAPVHIRVKVPAAQASVWFNDRATSQTGMERLFVSPLLEPGNKYHYVVKAEWDESGETVSRTREVIVQAGESVNVDFMAGNASPQEEAEVLPRPGAKESPAPIPPVP